MLSKLDKRHNSKKNLFYKKSDFQEEIEQKTDYNIIINSNFNESNFNNFLEDNYFLEKKKLREEKEFYDVKNEPKISFDIVKDIFSNKNSFEKEEKENIYRNLSKPQRNHLFDLKVLLTPGRKRKSSNKGEENKRRHDKTSFDNVITKVQVHYISFIINFANDIIF